MFRIAFLVCLPLLFSANGLLAQSHSITYQWLNVPCFSNINCNTGCSACNVPENATPVFFGTNMIWPGLTLCPHPVTTANNAVHSEGWSPFVSPNIHAMLSGMSTIPMQVDSLIIRHRSSETGPQRLRISFTTDMAQPHYEIGDVEITTEWSTTVLTGMGRMDIGPGQDFGVMQLKFQAYQGQAGSWQLDEVRVVASPATDITTGIAVIDHRYDRFDGQYVDVLGRPVGKDAAPGMYFGNKRVVRVE
jgi:hypothetical protein